MADELLIKDLRTQIERRQVIAIVGAGVSMAATDGNQLASWIGLLEDGVQRCCDLFNGVTEGWKERVLSEIQSRDIDDLLSAAEKVSRKLGAPSGGQYRRWLRETVGSLHPKRSDVIKALQALGVKFATTNYDGLIKEVIGSPPVTWKEDAKVERVIRDDDQAVLHLHGYWDQPESVILGIRSYEEVLGSVHAQNILHALQTVKTLLFVGCGTGLKDPNFGGLLRWTGAVFSGSEYWRFRLAKESEVDELQKEHPPEQNFFVLSFGKDHADLAPFLRSLAGQDTTLAEKDVAPIPDRPLPAPNAQLTLKPDISPAPRQDIRGLDWYDECDAGDFIGRNKDVGDILSMLLFDPIIRLVGPSGIGKSSLIRAGLLPKIREYGWRACVIRPFENPAQCIPLQLTAELTMGPATFTTPLDPAQFRAEVSPLLSSNGINRLVLFLDQFEDIVSPVAASGAMDAMREFLWELWEQKETKPYLRAVVLYRTDAEARLGRFWQEVSGRPEGLPYLALQGLHHSVAEDIIKRTAWEQGWRLEMSVPDIVRQLSIESQKLDCSNEVFPVYLQIFLKQAQQNPEGRITADFITSLGGVSGVIGKYLQQTLGRLKTRGGDWKQCDAVLECLCRSTGTKAPQSLNDLVRETGLSRAVLAEMVSVLMNERLVRPVGHESYEIQHDLLAATVIQTMKDSDREAKAAREFLSARVPVFEQTMVPLKSVELVYLYRHRRKIHSSEKELKFLLTSLLHNIIERWQRNKSPAAYWFRKSPPQKIPALVYSDRTLGCQKQPPYFSRVGGKLPD